MSACWEIQKAIYNMLVADSALMTLVNYRVYDTPPTNAVYPYIAIGNMTEIPDNTLDNIGYESTIMVSIYTKPDVSGFYEAKSIYAIVNSLLNMQKASFSIADDLYPSTTNYPASINSLHCLMIMLDNVITIKEGDKKVIDARYRVQVEQY